MIAHFNFFLIFYTFTDQVPTNAIPVPKPKDALIPDEIRANLMNQIRNSGGLKGAGLKSREENQIYTYSTNQLTNYMKEQKSQQEKQRMKQGLKQVKVKGRVPGGGDFMADLANKLRR